MIARPTPRRHCHTDADRTRQAPPPRHGSWPLDSAVVAAHASAVASVMRSPIRRLRTAASARCIDALGGRPAGHEVSLSEGPTGRLSALRRQSAITSCPRVRSLRSSVVVRRRTADEASGGRVAPTAAQSIQRARRCHAGSLEAPQGTDQDLPVTGSTSSCGRGSPLASTGVPRTSESSGDHSHDEQHPASMAPG
jgi:hypothetical protein